jgi:hypothetical protein
VFHAAESKCDRRDALAQQLEFGRLISSGEPGDGDDATRKHYLLIKDANDFYPIGMSRLYETSGARSKPSRRSSSRELRIIHLDYDYMLFWHSTLAFGMHH